MANRRITIDQWKHIPAGNTVWNGYAVNSTCTAPKEPGLYTLYEIADENNCHIGWEWEKEEEKEKK